MSRTLTTLLVYAIAVPLGLWDFYTLSRNAKKGVRYEPLG